MLESLIIQFLVVPCEHVFFASGVLEFVMRTVTGASTQNLLNQALAPIERDLAVGYGEILLALAVTLVHTRPDLCSAFHARFGATVSHFIWPRVCTSLGISIDR